MKVEFSHSELRLCPKVALEKAMDKLKDIQDELDLQVRVRK